MKTMKKEHVPQIGEIYLVNFKGVGNEQKGLRPALVFQNNIGNQYSPNLIVLPLTSALKKASQPTHVFVPKEIGLKKDSMVLCENPVCVSKCRMGNYLITLPESYMEKVAIGNLLATSAISFMEPELLLNIWQEATALNATVS